MATTIQTPLPSDPESTMLLLAATDHNISVLESLLKNTSANVYEPETRQTALHVAIASCTPEDSDEELKAAEETLKLLLLNGAIWNDLDVSGETPACIADRLGLKNLYDIMVEAGVRAELILGRLGGYLQLSDGEESEEETEDDDEAPELAQESETVGTPQTEVTQPELEPAEEIKEDVNSKDYLASKLTYHDDKLLDADNNGVMMEWERGIMERSADALVKEKGKRILNIGFGMGIIDGLFQEKKPSHHVIVEAHPDVLKKMKEDGWYEKEGVEVLEGRWQDVIPDLVNRGTTFHAIYFDTFAESYDELRLFFTEYVIALLAPLSEGGKFSFFHGLGADRRVSYDVYTRIVEIDMLEAGLETRWDVMPLKKDDEEDDGMEEGGKVWDGVKRRYWILPEYKLPIAEFLA